MKTLFCHKMKLNYGMKCFTLSYVAWNDEAKVCDSQRWERQGRATSQCCIDL